MRALLYCTSSTRKLKIKSGQDRHRIPALRRQVLVAFLSIPKRPHDHGQPPCPCDLCAPSPISSPNHLFTWPLAFVDASSRANTPKCRLSAAKGPRCDDRAVVCGDRSARLACPSPAQNDVDSPRTAGPGTLTLDAVVCGDWWLTDWLVAPGRCCFCCFALRYPAQ